MVNTKLYTAKGTKILTDRSQMLIGNLWINSHSQKNILTVAAYIAHTCKRLVITGPVQTTLICKIVIIWEIPCKLNRRICVNYTGTSRPPLIIWIIAVHQINRSVRSAQLLQDIVLIDILSSLTTVSQINSTLCRSHMKGLCFQIAHYNTVPF